jgi:hypothetical protein
MRRAAHSLCLASGIVAALAAFVARTHGGEPAPGTAPSAQDPDPLSVERYGRGYRYPRRGWIVLHVEGEPYERGFQHGHLLAPELAANVRTLALSLHPKSPEDGWRTTRMLTDALFTRRYDREYVLEMKGIADGASAAGARVFGRPIDLVDVIAVNAWTEITTLEPALEATPRGIEGMKLPEISAAPPRPVPSRCSAFVATGPATRDRRLVFGHITMFDLYQSRWFNVWIDVKPSSGHRFFMQSYPGGIQSSMDYYFNDAGLVLTETTLDQTGFQAEGEAEASRVRRAIQYSATIDDAVATLRAKNNGLYTNEWLLGDTKTDEIALFELGTEKSRLLRSSKGEWFGDTEGFYWGCNNAKDVDLRLETLASAAGKPANVVFRPDERDIAWQELYAKHKGTIDASFGFEALSTPPIAASASVDAKFATAGMIQGLTTWAIFGPPTGRTWEPTPKEREKFPDIEPLVSNGWTVLDAKAPAEGAPTAAIDLASTSSASFGAGGAPGKHGSDDDDAPSGLPSAAWHGTLLPKTDGDAWLAMAFADYERVVSQEAGKGDGSGQLKDAATDATALALFPHRTRYLQAALDEPRTSLANVHLSTRSRTGYDLASGKGVFVLAELRAALGDAKFRDLMDAFGREHAGQAVATEEFRAAAEKAADEPLGWVFDSWVSSAAIPSLTLADVKVSGADASWHVTGSIRQGERRFKTRVEVGLETGDGASLEHVALEAAESTSFDLTARSRPRELILDPRQRLLKEGDAPFSLHAFESEPGRALIVYGTGPEVESLRDAAQVLRRRIAASWSGSVIPIVSDKELEATDLATHHLLLLGRPAMNSVVERFRDALPVTFGAGSFSVAGECYANPASAVAVAAPNPIFPRFSLLVLAGLSAESTRRLVQEPLTDSEVMAWPAGGSTEALVLPAKRFRVRFEEGE